MKMTKISKFNTFRNFDDPIITFHVHLEANGLIEAVRVVKRVSATIIELGSQLSILEHMWSLDYTSIEARLQRYDDLFLTRYEEGIIASFFDEDLFSYMDKFTLKFPFSSTMAYLSNEDKIETGDLLYLSNFTRGGRQEPECTLREDIYNQSSKVWIDPKFAPIRCVNHQPEIDYKKTNDLYEFDFSIELWNDLWLPLSVEQQKVFADRGFEVDRDFLSKLHAPRLNSFLKHLYDSVKSVGGQWEIYFENKSLLRRYGIANLKDYMTKYTIYQIPI